MNLDRNRIKKAFYFKKRKSFYCGPEEKGTGATYRALLGTMALRVVHSPYDETLALMQGSDLPR